MICTSLSIFALCRGEGEKGVSKGKKKDAQPAKDQMRRKKDESKKKKGAAGSVGGNLCPPLLFLEPS